MKYVLALASCLALIVALPQPAAAQDRERERGAEEDRHRRGGQGGRRWGGWGINPERMKAVLELNDEQVTKLKAMQEQMTKERQEFFKQMREGTWDREKMRETFRKARDTYNQRLKAILTEEQIKAWEKERRSQRRGWGNQGRERMAKRLREQIIKTLALNQEEGAVIVPLLDGALKAHKDVIMNHEDRRKKLLDAIRKADDAVLKQHLKGYREARARDVKALKAAQLELQEVLTPAQEAVLLAYNILD